MNDARRATEVAGACAPATGVESSQFVEAADEPLASPGCGSWNLID
jgi:hypothetical protein